MVTAQSGGFGRSLGSERVLDRGVAGPAGPAEADGRQRCRHRPLLRAGPRPFVVRGEGGLEYLCARCRLPLREGWTYCPGCESAIGWVRTLEMVFECGVCGERLERGWRFCPACTYRIKW